MDSGERLDGGNVGGAVRIGDTVRRAAGPWTAAVHALLAHLAAKRFTAAPRPLGFDEQGREILTFLDGQTVGSGMPWPAWVHADDTLGQVARWMRAYHQAVADFRPPPDAVWIGGNSWSPGLIIGHNDAAPYNAAWQHGRLTGFFDWDLAGPVTPAWDLAFTAFSWVPLHARHLAAAEGFTDFAARPRRLRRFLDTYGWSETTADFLDVVRNASRPTPTASEHWPPPETPCSSDLSIKASPTIKTKRSPISPPSPDSVTEWSRRREPCAEVGRPVW